MKKQVKIDLLVIDPQVDFCDPKGSLYVPGAEQDMRRLADMIYKNRKKIDDIHCTLDSHHLVDIAHPIFWKDSAGQHPQPFTIINVDDVDNGVWNATNPQFQKRAFDYVKALAADGRYPLCIWPPHTLIGSIGAAILPDLFNVFLKWEDDFAMIDTVTKGSNFWTEHYSAVMAEIPDPADPGTSLNTRLIQTLQNADIIGIAGEARSHCVANTIRDIANNFGEENIKKFVLIEDCTSDVPTFEFLGEAFVKEMKGRGMQVATSDTFF